MAISVVVPSYRNPKYLDFCLNALLENQLHKNEIIVVIDGYPEESRDVIDKYKNIVYFVLFDENQELPTSLNAGVYNATNEKILILNEDNVVGKSWDFALESEPLMLGDGETEWPVVYTVNQVEPIQSIYDFTIQDLGRDVETFKYKEWIAYEESIRTKECTPQGNTWPAFFDKRLFMQVGGFDPLYGSGYFADWDFFLKLEMSGCTMLRTRVTNVYHFISKSIKRSDIEYKATEKEVHAREIFIYKWGYSPFSQRYTHSHKPTAAAVRGVRFV